MDSPATTETAPTQATTPASSALLVASTLKRSIAVHGRDGKKLGTVEQFLTDMLSGQARYAVLSFGGFLGLGQKYHPVPFAFLRVSADGNGYIVDIDKSIIDGSPSYRDDDAPLFDDAYGRRITSYYSAGHPGPAG